MCLCIKLYVVVVKVVAIRNYQPPGSRNSDSSSEEGEGGEKEEKEVNDNTNESETDGKDEEKPKESEGKKVGLRREEETCLEGLSDDIQDMLVVGDDLHTRNWCETQHLSRLCKRLSSALFLP